MPKVLFLLNLIAWGSVYLSHKISGPLYRLLISLQELGKGDMRVRIHLRKFDEAHFLETQFNETADNLDKTFSRIKAIANESADRPDRLKNQLQEELKNIKTRAER